MSFKDFKGAAPLIQALFNTVRLPIADSFSARLADLENAAKNIGGYPPADDYPYDLSLQFEALPKVPLLLLFNDQDEEFADVLKMGRTENQDAVPMTLGQEFSTYAVMIESAAAGEYDGPAEDL